MLFPIKRVLFEYCALVLKPHQDVGIINHPIYNMFFICDSEVMFGLSYIMAMLEGWMNWLSSLSTNSVLYVILLPQSSSAKQIFTTIP